MKNIKAIIFDLDGTLVDSGADLAASVNHALRHLGLEKRSLREVQGFVGDGVQPLIDRALGRQHLDLAQDALALFMDHYQRHCTDRTTLYPGVAEVLPRLATDFRLAVLTNKVQALAVTILNNLSIARYFDEIIGGDSLAAKKPDPAGILHLAELWGMKPSQLLMVGDHVTDITSGINAGCKTLFLEGGIGTRGDLTPDATIKRITDLPGVLARLP